MRRRCTHKVIVVFLSLNALPIVKGYLKCYFIFLSCDVNLQLTIFVMAHLVNLAFEDPTFES